MMAAGSDFCKQEDSEMLRLIKSSPPIFEFEIDRDGVQAVIKVKALYWYDYDAEARQDKLQTSIDRFAFEKNLDCWLCVFEYQQLDEWRVSKEIVGNDDGLIARYDLLRYCKISGSGLNNRIEMMNHPKPVKVGRKHWFNVDEVDAWIKKQNAK